MNTFRRRTRRAAFFAIALAVPCIVAVTASTTQAVLVTNVTDGSTLFSADFENGTPNTAIAAGSPAVGAWITEVDAPGRQTVEDSASEGTAAFQGNNFAKLIKSYNGSPNPLKLVSVFDGTALGNSGTGDLIRLETALQVKNPDGGPPNTLAIQFFDGSQNVAPWGDMLLEFQFGGDGSVLATDINFAPFPKTITAGHTVDAWNTVRIDYVNGSGSFDISINGGAVQTVTNETVPDGNITGIRFLNRDTPATSGAYIDAVGAISLPGDLNGDGFVGQDDLNFILGKWGTIVTPGSFTMGDPSGDGFVGQDDLNILLGHWGEGTPPLTLAGSSLSAAAVPEPSSVLLTVIGIAGLACFSRRRRHREEGAVLNA